MKLSLRLWAAGFACALAAGCATPPPAPLAVPSDLFNDARFGAASQQINADRLFDMSPEMIAYLNSGVFKTAIQRRGPEQGLVDALYDRQSLRLDYDGSITRTAAETYAAKRGNCLSLVLMTAAFARALKLDVRFQDVQLDTEWNRDGDLYMGYTHVNLSISVPSTGTSYAMSPDRTTIDFVPPPQTAKQRFNRLTENMVRAMYMNNRAVEEFASGHYDNAYWWAKAALEREPGLVKAYNTLGVVYQKHGDSLLAERVYKRALALAPADTVVMNNLAPLLEVLGKVEESRALKALATRLDPEPPFYFYEKGVKAMEAGRFVEARQLFGREVRRSPYNHEFHYWLAMAHVRLGEAKAARDEMAIALDNSTSTDASKRYSSKLAALRALR